MIDLGLWATEAWRVEGDTPVVNEDHSGSDE